MSKYEPLTHFLMAQSVSQYRMKFSDIETVLGFSLPDSSKTHRAWWSNNPSNNVMTKAWLKAGWETEQVDMANEQLVFVKSPGSRERDPVSFPEENLPPVAAAGASVFGSLKGTVTIRGDILSTGEQWNAERGELT